MKIRAPVVREFGDLQQKENESCENFFRKCVKAFNTVVKEDLPEAGSDKRQGFDEARFLFLKLAFVSGLKEQLRKDVIKSDGALKSLERVLEFAKSLEEPKSCDADFVSQYE